MKSITALTIAAVAALGFAAPASAGKPGLYSGSYLVTITQSTGQGNFDGQHCLILTDDGSLGFPHSGEATMPNAGVVFGTFYIIGHTLLVTLDQPGAESGVDDSLVFSAPASSGIFGDGVFGQVYGAADNVGMVKFGNKGSC